MKCNDAHSYSLFQLCPENAEEYIDYLRSVGRLDEAALRLAAVVNDESFVSKEGKSNYQVRVSQGPFECTILNFKSGFLRVCFNFLAVVA